MGNVTALNAAELAKLEKDGLDAIHDIPRLAKEGFKSIQAADFDRLKYFGLYQQRPKAEGNFMLRVKVPGGNLTADQARTLADISEQFGRGVVDITNRHSVQFHWIKIENVPAILETLAGQKLTTMQAAGDCPRSIVANPLDGRDPDEFLDTREIFKELNGFFHNNRDFSNLPRKFKTAISGGLYNSVHAELNDLAFIPALKDIDGQQVKGFNVLVGGGLSREPRLAWELNAFVQAEEVVKVAAGVAALFRDHGYREKRNHARLKFLIEDWGIEKFRAELVKLTGPLSCAGQDMSKGWNAGKFYGLNKQRQLGLNYFGLSLVSGRLSTGELREFARLADIYGSGQLITTNSQDIIIPDIPDEKVPALNNEPIVAEQKNLWSSLKTNTVVCTGSEFCPFAVTETKERARTIADDIEEAVGSELRLRLHISGCGHSCGQPQVADIGLQGAVVMQDGKPAEGFEIWVGGQLGENPRFGKKLAGIVSADEVTGVLIDMINRYKRERKDNETFSDYIYRTAQEKQDIAS